MVASRARAGLLLAVTCCWFASPGASPDPEALIQSTAAALFSALEGERGARPRAIVDAHLGQRLDAELMARIALGAHWGAATAEQRSRITGCVRQRFLDGVAAAIERYPTPTIEYLPSPPTAAPEPAAPSANVRTRVHLASGMVVRLDYHLHASADGWRLYDIRIDGISLVRSYRASFASHIRQHGLPALLDALGC